MHALPSSVVAAPQNIPLFASFIRALVRAICLSLLLCFVFSSQPGMLHGKVIVLPFLFSVVIHRAYNRQQSKWIDPQLLSIVSVVRMHMQNNDPSIQVAHLNGSRAQWAKIAEELPPLPPPSPELVSPPSPHEVSSSEQWSCFGKVNWKGIDLFALSASIQACIAMLEYVLIKSTEKWPQGTRRRSVFARACWFSTCLH